MDKLQYEEPTLELCAQLKDITEISGTPVISGAPR